MSKYKCVLFCYKMIFWQICNSERDILFCVYRMSVACMRNDKKWLFALLDQKLSNCLTYLSEYYLLFHQACYLTNFYLPCWQNCLHYIIMMIIIVFTLHILPLLNVLPSSHVIVLPYLVVNMVSKQKSQYLMPLAS